MSIYISYAPVAAMWANDLQTRLVKLGYDVSDIPITLEDASHVLVVTTPISADSPQIRQDVAAAYKQRKIIIPVIPKHVVGGSLHWMPDYLAMMEYIDFSTNDAAAFTTLLERLGNPTLPPQLDPYELPKASLQLIMSERAKQRGKTWPIEQPQTLIGSQRRAHVRLPQLAAPHCTLMYNAVSQRYQLSRTNSIIFVTVHDQVLPLEQPTALQHGDLIMLTAQTVLQFFHDV